MFSSCHRVCFVNVLWAQAASFQGPPCQDPAPVTIESGGPENQQVSALSSECWGRLPTQAAGSHLRKDSHHRAGLRADRWPSPEGSCDHKLGTCPSGSGLEGDNGPRAFSPNCPFLSYLRLSRENRESEGGGIADWCDLVRGLWREVCAGGLGRPQGSCWPHES